MHRRLGPVFVLLAAGALASCGLAVDTAAPNTTTTAAPAAPFSPAPASRPPDLTSTPEGIDPDGGLAATTQPAASTTTILSASWCDQYLRFTTAGTKLVQSGELEEIKVNVLTMISSLQSVTAQAANPMRDRSSLVLRYLEELRDGLTQVSSADDGFRVLRALVDREEADIDLLIETGGEQCTGTPGVTDFDLIPE